MIEALVFVCVMLAGLPVFIVFQSDLHILIRTGNALLAIVIITIFAQIGFVVKEKQEFVDSQCKYDIWVEHSLAYVKHLCVKSYKVEGEFLIVVDAYDMTNKAYIKDIAYITRHNTYALVEKF